MLTRSPAYRLQVLERALLLLDTLAEAEGNLTLNELTPRLGLHKSTAHRLLMVLEHHRFVRRGPNGAYSLGMKLFALGARAMAQIRLRARSEPILRSLAQLTCESAQICILDRSETLAIANVAPPWVVRIPSTLDYRLPVHCTAVGKVLCAFLGDSARASLLAGLQLTPYTPNTYVTRSTLEAELSRVTRAGLRNRQRREGNRPALCWRSGLRRYRAGHRRDEHFRSVVSSNNRAIVRAGEGDAERRG